MAQDNPIDLPRIQPGSYDRLNDADKAIVDSILVSNAFEAAARAEVTPADASETDRAMLALTTAVNNQQRTTPNSMDSFVGEMVLEIERDHYADKPELLAAVRAIHRREQTPAAEMTQYTRLVNDMIAVDGNQFEVQRDLPEIIAPNSQGQRR